MHPSKRTAECSNGYHLPLLTRLGIYCRLFAKVCLTSYLRMYCLQELLLQLLGSWYDCHRYSCSSSSSFEIATSPECLHLLNQRLFGVFADSLSLLVVSQMPAGAQGRIARTDVLPPDIGSWVFLQHSYTLGFVRRRIPLCLLYVSTVNGFYLTGTISFIAFCLRIRLACTALLFGCRWSCQATTT
jgi:hypothetical protein